MELWGGVYSYLGDNKKTTEYVEQAIKIFQDPKIEARREEGVALEKLGIAYSDMGDNRKAIEYHEQALQIFQEPKI